MKRSLVVFLCACSSNGSDSVDAASGDAASGSMSFFITSRPLDGGKLGGLDGADAHCRTLATAVGAGGRTWRAYLSRSALGIETAVDARDRIGAGPWRNAAGVIIAANVTELHGTNMLDGTTGLNEKGERVPGRGSTPNQHDILTGSTAEGRAYPPDPDKTCVNWTSNATGSARVGHHDRVGGGSDPSSWNSAHDSAGCSMSALIGTGGNGYFYCFAAD